MAMIVDTPRTLSWPALGGLRARLAHLKRIAAERRHLATLDASQLADIGLTVEQAHNEANRPFWDAPDHWHR
jgi:uncharacterized protein YjiS (DUF1127 family)